MKRISNVVLNKDILNKRQILKALNSKGENVDK